MNEKSIILSKPQEEVLRSTKQRILALAGQAGGKSHIAGLISAELIINYPQARGFIGANTHNQLSKATLDRVFQVWGEMFNWKRDKQYTVNIAPPKEWIKYGQKLESYEKTICFDNGAVIFTASLENYMAIDGTEFTWGILDETKDTREEAVKEVITGRLRQKTLWAKDGLIYDKPVDGSVSWNPLYVLTSPAKVRWINEWFELDDKYEEISKKIFSKTDYYSLETKDKHVVIYSTYHNETNLSSGYIEQRLNDLKGSPHLIDMLIYGSPIAKSGGEFFSQFRRLGHVKKVDFIEGKPIHISLDFNVSPYITMTCWQIIRDGDMYKVNCFDELCLASPKNNTEALCKEFELKYLYNTKTPLFYYGDASGTNQSTVSKEHNFDVLERILKKYLNDNSNRVLKKNPSVIGTRDFVNKIFANGLPIEISISDKCKNLIADLEFMKEAPDGGKLIEKAKDPVTGGTYERFGHCFIAGTKIKTINGDIDIEKIKVGDLVLTRNGYKKVLRSFMSQKNATVKEYDFGFTKIICTPNHKFYCNGKFKEVQLLTRKDILCIFDEQKQSICKRKLSYLMEENFIDTKTQKTVAIENTLKGGLILMEKKLKPIYIELFGWINSEKYRKAAIYTIRTAIIPITTLITFSVLIKKLTCQTIIKKCLNHGKEIGFLICSQKQYRHQKSGINQIMGSHGIRSTFQNHWLNILLKKITNALIAKRILHRRQAIKCRNFAQKIVKVHSEENLMLTMKIESVCLAALSFLTINMQQKNIVQKVRTENVYDLEIEEEHEFFANNILVHNCSDSLRYFLVSAFNSFYKPE